jgi:adenylate cyclase
MECFRMSTTPAPAFFDGEVNGRKLEVRLAEVCRLGRDDANDLVLELASVSRNHALVYCLEAGIYYINDLNSFNGTFVNGSRVSAPTLLKDGDSITLGTCELRFRQQQAPRPVSPAPVKNLNPTSVLLAPKLITVLVADIRGFTVLAQRLDAELLPRITGALFREAGDVLRERGAWGQKYIGDAVMAVWLHAESAEREIVDIMAALARLAEIAAGLQSQFHLEQPIRIGVGLSSGVASLGNQGSAAAPDFTALGDTVNRAFRLESATKEVGWDVALGEDTYGLIGSLGNVRDIFQPRMLRLKGYAEPVNAWGTRFEALLPALDPIRGNSDATKATP